MNQLETTPVEKWVLKPVGNFMSQSTSSGIVLFISAALALILSNSPWSLEFEQLWQTKFRIGIGSFEINKPLQLWINDGLMSMFFFVVGLELKREIIAGELADPRKAILPVVAGLGGFLLPALIYWTLNQDASIEAANGWGIPMATDIAFALGVLYLLGDRVPLSLKVFLTALAIIDDLGAVLVIALFYTSKISLFSLGIGAVFLSLMILGNVLGVRNAVFYGALGIVGLWTAFLLSGVHATIAAVLAAFTIPANVKISKPLYVRKIRFLLHTFDKKFDDEAHQGLLSYEEQKNLDKIQYVTKGVIPPLQKLEHGMHPLVAFVVMPIFAFANAGVSFSGDVLSTLASPVTLGIILGLLLGKVIGISGAVYLGIKTKLVVLPEEISFVSIVATSFLAAIGFTMSLFITTLAFSNEAYILQAKVGILLASLVAGVIGYLLLQRSLEADNATTPE
ncbi:Na+/H+ antiporter NhaA [Eisenibacter elegans]|uniref:Na+/H+ antiporter NhaA n=1 Tax=Eisenibacter elegans TaxID=997 RepID=UPI00041E485F|nr:Na+/H+ antiporter NhaA [Eisenibacter elegans]